MIELEEKRIGVHIVIDYFSATFPFICYEEDSEYSIVNDIILMACNFFNIKKEDVYQEDYAMHRFEYQYKLSDHITLRLCGPELKIGHKSCSIELSGQGCREFEGLAKDRTWLDLLEFFIVKLNASPTRIDIAIDDYDGNIITFEEVKRKLDLSHFTTSFQDKDFIMHGSNKKGISIQFGSHSSTQMLVIYEKLKEQITKGLDYNPPGQENSKRPWDRSGHL
jgi:DNA relaxase NicK